MDLHFLYVTMDGLHNAALREAARLVEREHGVRVQLMLHTTNAIRSQADWDRLAADAARADFIFGCMIFGEEYVRPMQRILAGASAPILFITSNPALIYSTRLGSFSLEQRPDEEKGLVQRWMQKLRPKKQGRAQGHSQTALLKNLTKLMKYVPGKMRGLHTFISAHDYWLHSSPENLARMICLHAERFVPGFEGKLPTEDPVSYPDGAIYHPDAPQPFENVADYRAWRKGQGKPVGGAQGVVGLLTMRAIILTGNTAHIDNLIRELDAQGLEARAAYSSLMDFRPAIDQFFAGDNGLPKADALLNCIGFPLVGGPAGARPDEAVERLQALDIPYYDMVPLSFQRIEDWREDEMGLMPIQMAMNISLPELDGIAEPVLFGGPTRTQEQFIPLQRETNLAARRIARRIRLAKKGNAEKKVAVVLFNFPPNLGNVGTAAFLDVFASLQRLLAEMQAQGYQVDLPADPDALRRMLTEGNAARFGTDGNVAAHLSLDDYRRLFPWHVEIEEYWGYAPGELLTDGQQFHILGVELGNVFVGIQPSFGYERDPMRLLMGKDASPHHGFAAFYAWLNDIYDADAVVHFGTHGALEFMPGKQNGVSADCWPHRLLGALPNFYYYCVNNPSEGSIAKRRGAATLVSYMVPPLQQAGLYKGLRLLKDSIDTYHSRPDPELLADIRTQAERLGISVDGAAPAVNGSGHAPAVNGNGHAPAVNGNGHAPAANGNGHANGQTPVNGNGHALLVNGNGHAPAVNGNGHRNGHRPVAEAEQYLAALGHELLQVEHRMIPLGLHVLGRAPVEEELVDMLSLVVSFNGPLQPDSDEKLPPLPLLVARGKGWDFRRLQETVKSSPEAQARWETIEGIVRESMVRFVAAPRAGGLDPSGLDTYLQAEAGIPAGLLSPLWPWLEDLLQRIINDGEIAGLLHGLDGGYILPSPGNDVMRNDAIVPTGRNIHALDPYRVPSAVANAAADSLVKQMLERLTAEQGRLPETVAMVLWGTDNLKSDGEGIAQCLALVGARALEDELGNITDVALIPLAELERPRIDVVMTLSGIFRDLFHHQAGLLDKAMRLAAAADEPPERNFVRKHALAHAAELEISVDEAAARVFSNAAGSYGAHVNHLVESAGWEEDDQLSEAFLARKSYAYSSGGQWRGARAVMERSLATVEATFQNIDSFEMGISDVDHYYEYLGGVAKSVEKLNGGRRPPVLVADALALEDRLSSLEQMVRLESRAKLLNPKWYDAMLSHGYEGVREIELRVSNTYGWSATADAVEGWVYEDVAETFLLDEAMRARMAEANPHATAAIARRLLEADARGFWDTSEEMLDQLRQVYADLEDRMEGIVAAA